MPIIRGIESRSTSPTSVPSTTVKAKAERTERSEQRKTRAEFAAESDAVVLKASLEATGSDAAQKRGKSERGESLYNSLSLTARQIVDKINEQLKVALPEGVQSLSPEEVTPEATAERIVSGVTAFFEVYAKQNSNLSGDELVDSFISEVTRGVNQGYGDAVKILEGIGAFDVEGVRDGVERTRTLIDEKLATFAEKKKLALSGSSAVEETKDGVLTQAGAAIDRAS